MTLKLAQLAVAVGDNPIVTAHALRQNDQQIFRELMRSIHHAPEYRLVYDKQMGVFCADDISGRIAVFDNRHLTDAGTGFHGGKRRCADGPDVNVEAAGQDHENMFIFFARRQQQLTGREVASITVLQQCLDVVREHALEQFQAVQQRPLVIRVYRQCFRHPAILADNGDEK